MKLKVISIVIASLLGHTEQAVIFPEELPIIYQDDQIITEDRFEECAAENDLTMPYYDTMCYQLMTRGPCLDKEWFVLDALGDPICKNRKCLEPNSVTYNGECRAIGDNSLCPKHMELMPNLLGEGACDCKEGFGRLQGFEECHPLLNSTRGPCNDGQWLVLDKASLWAVCHEIVCPKDNYRLANGTCVEIALGDYQCQEACSSGCSQMFENLHGEGECKECSEESCPEHTELRGGTFDVPLKRTIINLGQSRKRRYAGGCNPLCIRRRLRRKRNRKIEEQD